MSGTVGPGEAPRARLERRIGLTFADATLLARALRHRSADGQHNERLEFLGDAVIGLYVAESLYRAAPHAREGDLSRLRATLVRRESLARLARELDLGSFVELGGGMLKSGGRDYDSILADALEALVGAVYLDRGADACREWLTTLFEKSLAAALASPPRKDHKTRLQEFLQARGESLPEYAVVEEGGAAHQRVFTVECRLPGARAPQTGTAGSRRRAEQEAARLALRAITDD